MTKSQTISWLLVLQALICAADENGRVVFNTLQAEGSSAGSSKRTTENYRNSQVVLVRFQNWKDDFNKTYKGRNAESRAEDNFTENDERIKSFNKQANRTYEQGHNSYSDRSFEDDKKHKSSLDVPEDKKSDKFLKADGMKAKEALPKYVNHTKYLSAAKDQLECGACYVFSAMGAVEFDTAVKRRPRDLSEQNLIDCDDASGACDGGWPTKSLRYIQNYGVASQKQYKYANGKQSCMRSKYPPVVNITKACEDRLKGDEEALKVLVSKRPVAVAIQATINFMYYKSGIFSDPECAQKVDHAVLVVGYGTDEKLKMDYWIIRNSWSVNWGMQGYGLVQRNANNMCGIALYAMYVC